MTNYWFECKVAYERSAENMGLKKVSEIYLVDALSFTEAEERIISEIRPLVSTGDLEIVNIKRVKIAELFDLNNEGVDKYYRARVNFITVDEKSGTEKKTGHNMLVRSESLVDALARIDEEMQKQLGLYEIASITDTPILDVFTYEPPAK